MWSKCLALTVTVTVNNTIDLLLWTTTSMVHLWSQWWVKQTGGYLVVIVSEGVQLRLTRQVRSGLTGSVSVMTRWLGTRLSIRCRVRKNRLPPVYITIISDTLPLDIWHSTFGIRHLAFDIIYIGIGMAVSNLSEVIILKIDHIKWSQINLKFQNILKRNIFYRVDAWPWTWFKVLMWSDHIKKRSH
jgi:hypothetical protein